MRCPQPGLLEVSTSDKDPTGVDLTNAELKAFQHNWSKGSPCPERTFSSFSWIAAFTKVVRIPTFSPFTQRLLFGSWRPACPLPSEAKRPSHSPDEIDEYAFVVVLQIGQVVGEVGEVEADAGLQVLANMTIDRGQCAAAPLIYIRQVKRSYLGQAIPFLEEPPVHAQHRELRWVVEETRVHAIQTFLSHAIRVLASKGPIRREVVVHIQRRDVALLKELGRGVLQSHLTCGRDVIEVRVLDQRVQPVVPYRTVRVADHGLGVAAGIELAERAITDRVVQLADKAPVGRQLQLEIVTKQPCSRFGMRQVELFRVIPAILDRAQELHLTHAVAHADTGRLAIGLGAGFRVA